MPRLNRHKWVDVAEQDRRTMRWQVIGDQFAAIRQARDRYDAGLTELATRAEATRYVLTEMRRKTKFSGRIPYFRGPRFLYSKPAEGEGV